MTICWWRSRKVLRPLLVSFSCWLKKTRLNWSRLEKRLPNRRMPRLMSVKMNPRKSLMNGCDPDPQRDEVVVGPEVGELGFDEPFLQVAKSAIATVPRGRRG